LINNSNDKIPKIIDSGGGDVMVTDIWEYKYYAKFLKNIFQLNKIRFSSDHMVCFTNKNNREILKLFNKFLVSIKKNGFLHKTIKKYCA
jgi:ABC-type amino acid transport substrate-binding protein